MLCPSFIWSWNKYIVVYIDNVPMPLEFNWYCHGPLDNLLSF